MAQDVTLQITGLEQLLKALKAKPPQARVGIIGGRDNRQIEDKGGSGTSVMGNAEVGAMHEFGTSTLPRRSFLVSPIVWNLQKYMQRSKALDKNVLNEVIKSGSVLPWVQKVTKMAELIVLEAFDTAGFGKWEKWKSPSYTNNTGQILVDTQQLRNSITSEVRE
jgi:phage gpG-like protein